MAAETATKKTRVRKNVDPEAKAISVITEALNALEDAEARARVVRWIDMKFVNPPNGRQLANLGEKV